LTYFFRKLKLSENQIRRGIFMGKQKMNIEEFRQSKNMTFNELAEFIGNGATESKVHQWCMGINYKYKGANQRRYPVPRMEMVSVIEKKTKGVVDIQSWYR
jgi:hypothetical protein